MRLARPIYNKNGVLLYERNSKLTTQGIASIANFGLIGIYILEPAEPVPPMTKEDIEFERFQTMTVFAIQEELQTISRTKRAPKMQVIAARIIQSYGRLEKKINFVQSLRSQEDYIVKHSLNVSILCALISHVLNIKLEEQLDVVIAGIVHDVGKLTIPKSVLEHTELTEQDKEIVRICEISGFDIMEEVFNTNLSIKRICLQCEKALRLYKQGEKNRNKLVTGAKILMVAETFDTLTAMQSEQDPSSEVSAIRTLLENPEVFDENVVDALIRSIHILSAGTCIELNTGEKGLVIATNSMNILRPVVLGFDSNNIIDLGNEWVYGDLEIKDIMKTMDNRYIMDTSALKRQGITVEEPEYVKAPGETEEEYIPGRDF